MLILLLSFVGSGAKAQITILNAAKTMATVNIYLRFADQAEMTHFSLYYRIGENGTRRSVDGSIVRIMGREFIAAQIPNVPYDATNRCLVDPIFVLRGDISWKEGALTASQSIDNDMMFYGDAFLYVDKRHWLGNLVRYDYVIEDQMMEQAVIYRYYPETGLSEMLTPDDYGQTVWTLNTQDFRHVGNPDKDMTDYPYHTEAVFACKSAYRSWRYTIPEEDNKVYGDGLQQFGSDENLQRDDVFHASLTDGGDNAAVTFNTLREADFRPWPTECTATRSCIVNSYTTTQNAFDGFVGHLRLTMKGLSKTWKAESWVEYKNNNTHGWGTFCTPYDVEVPSGLLVLAVTNVLKQETASEPGRIDMLSMAMCPNIPKETGVVIVGTGTYEFHAAEPGEQLEADRAYYSHPEPDDYSVVNNMQYVPLSQINSVPYADGCYVLTYDGTKKAPLFKPAKGITDTGEWAEDSSQGCIPAFKSYLKINSYSDVGTGSGSSRSGLIGVMGEESTAVSSAQVLPTTPVVVTDLTGRRYDATRSLPRGIYVVNGRKVFIND